MRGGGTIGTDGNKLLPDALKLVSIGRRDGVLNYKEYSTWTLLT